MKSVLKAKDSQGSLSAHRQRKISNCSSHKMHKKLQAADDLVYKTKDSRASQQSHYSKKDSRKSKKERKDTSLQNFKKEDKDLILTYNTTGVHTSG